MLDPTRNLYLESLHNHVAVPSAHIHGPECNACTFYIKQSPGYCARRAHDHVRCVRERAWPLGVPQRCGPSAQHFVPREAPGA